MKKEKIMDKIKEDMDNMKKLNWDSHYFDLNFLKAFYNDNKEYINKTMQDVLLASINCMEYVIAEGEAETKTEIKNENNSFKVKCGDIIYVFDIDGGRTTEYEIDQIVITKNDTLLKDSYGEIICPLSFVDANKSWGFKGLYFSSDEKRQEFIYNNK